MIIKDINYNAHFEIIVNTSEQGIVSCFIPTLIIEQGIKFYEKYLMKLLQTSFKLHLVDILCVVHH